VLLLRGEMVLNEFGEFDSDRSKVYLDICMGSPLARALK